MGKEKETWAKQAIADCGLITTRENMAEAGGSLCSFNTFIHFDAKAARVMQLKLSLCPRNKHRNSATEC